jgi:hypothetical protein
MTEGGRKEPGSEGKWVYFVIGGFAVAIILILLFTGKPASPTNEAPSSQTVSAQPDADTAPPSPPKKVYKASDIEWEYAEDAIPYKAKVVAGINKLLRDNKRCEDVQTTSLYRAEGFTKKNPKFFIICEAKDGTSFGTTFYLKDVDSSVRFGAAPIIKEEQAKRLCEEKTLEEPNGLSSISFRLFFNGNFIPHPDGRATIALGFSAVNALGIRGDYRVACSFSGLALTEHRIGRDQ